MRKASCSSSSRKPFLKRCLHVLLALFFISYVAVFLLVWSLVFPSLSDLLLLLLPTSSPLLHHPLPVQITPVEEPQSASKSPPLPGRTRNLSLVVSGLDFSNDNLDLNASELHKSARHAWSVGARLFEELESMPPEATNKKNRSTEVSCPPSVTLSGEEFVRRGRVMELPCGLALGSHVTLVGRPRTAHPEKNAGISTVREGEQAVMVSQFMVELQGLKAVDGEEPPRILHFNPRLKGDWSGKPVIEQNTCYRMQWGSPLRCEGWKSRADEETVDGLVKCEKWTGDDDGHSEDTKKVWWLNRLIGRTNKVSLDWPFPFVEDGLFVLTLTAGLEGYHVSVDGRHVTSFPYRPGYVLEDATGLSLNGDLDIHHVIAASLPTSHPSFASQIHLEMSNRWKASPLLYGPFELFIGILSSSSHFAERMAVRKTWMSGLKISPYVVARFFIALNGRKEVNVELRKEAEFFGDIVIVPYLDSYDLVVLKTLAICEYGINKVSAKYIMKCDDDTFVRVDSVIKEVKKIPSDKSVYIGNMNYFHKPFRQGKWAETYEEWPEVEYPPYANGPGYIVSSDIAQFVVSDFEQHTLRLYKMEDVSMGMWVGKFKNTTRAVEYRHNVKFCQFGCIDNYYTSHYQSPRQMFCLWEKLKLGKPECCNMR